LLSGLSSFFSSLVGLKPSIHKHVTSCIPIASFPMWSELFISQVSPTERDGSSIYGLFGGRYISNQ